VCAGGNTGCTSILTEFVPARQERQMKIYRELESPTVVSNGRYEFPISSMMLFNV
jgi:hypothetical protein